MQRKLRDLLRLADLNESDIKVYLALLKRQQLTIPGLVYYAKLPNTTVYRALQRLEEQGLIANTPLDGKKSVYSALSLDNLVKRIAADQRKLRRLELQLKDMERFLPYIDEEDNEENDALIEIREGRDAVLEEYLKIPDVFDEEYLCFGNAPNFWKAVDINYEAPEERAFISKRLRNTLYARVINTISPESIEIQNNDTRELRVTMLKDEIPIIKDCMMFCDKQITHFVCDPDNPRAIIIRHPELIAGHLNQFNALWKK